MRCISKCNNYKNTKWALHEMFIVAKIVLKYYLAFSNIFPASISVSSSFCIFDFKNSPSLSFRPMHWEICGNWSIFRHFLLLPLLLSPPPTQKQTRKLKKKVDKHQNTWNNKSYSSFEYIKITTYFISCLIPSRCGIFLHHCELSEIFY